MFIVRDVVRYGSDRCEGFGHESAEIICNYRDHFAEGGVFPSVVDPHIDALAVH